MDSDHQPNGGLTAATRLIRRVTLPPTAYYTNAFDNNGRLLRTRLLTSANVELNDHEYVYNVGNQRTKQTRVDDSHVSYTYDDAGQLRTAATTNSVGSAVAAEGFQYGYDPAWNMVARTNNASVITYAPNNLNQITSHFAYDANGNGINFADTDFYYDDENRLVRVEDSSRGLRFDYLYDARGRLRARHLYILAGNWVFDGETRFVYDGMLMVQERDYDIPTSTYTRGLDLSGSLHGAGGIGGLLALSRQYNQTTGVHAETHYYHADGNGNITYLMQNNQTLAASYRYDPFGRTIATSGTYSSFNLMRFSSKMIDSTYNIYYYGYRWYDPNTQRWLNRDPIGESGGVNLYSYVQNNSLNRIDLFGERPFTSDERKKVNKLLDAIKACATEGSEKDVLKALASLDLQGIFDDNDVKEDPSRKDDSETTFGFYWMSSDTILAADFFQNNKVWGDKERAEVLIHEAWHAWKKKVDEDNAYKFGSDKCDSLWKCIQGKLSGKTNPSGKPGAK